jgi:hypothetical protein
MLCVFNRRFRDATIALGGSLAPLAMQGCVNAPPKFMAWEGPNAVIQGQGGTRETVDGMDVWRIGEPPREYRVLGVLETTRIYGTIQLGTNVEVVLVRKAREVGGDAIILRVVGSELSGVNQDGSVYYRRRHRATVIRYVD